MKVRNPTIIPLANSEGRKIYYNIDPNDPPGIPEISMAWQNNVRARDVAGAHGVYPLLYVLKHVKAGNFLRHMPGDPYFDSLVEDIAKNGIMEPVMVEVDRFGNVVLGEGHHRVASLLTIHQPYSRSNVYVPVRFWFREREYRPRNSGTQPTWVTFMKPNDFWKDMDTKPKKTKKERRNEARLAAHAARVAKLDPMKPVAQETDVTLQSLLDEMKEEQRKREIEEIINLLGMK